MSLRPLHSTACICAAFGLFAISFSACSGNTKNEGGGEDYESALREENAYLSLSRLQWFSRELSAYLEASNSSDRESSEASASRLYAQAIANEEALINGLKEDESLERRRVCAAVLGFTRKAKHATTLLEIASRYHNNDPRQLLRTYALFGIAALGEPIRNMPDPAARAAITDGLAALTVRTDDPAQVRQNAVVAYASAIRVDAGDSLAPLIDAVSNDPSPIVQAAAMLELGLLRDPTAAPVIGEVLRGATERALRIEAAQALQLIDSERSADILLSVLTTERDPLIKAPVLLAYSAQSKSVSAEARTKVVEPYTVDLEKGVREAAVRALGWIGDRSSIRMLVDAASDVEPTVRQRALSALRTLKPEEASEVKLLFPLIDRLEDSDSEVARQAYFLLKEATGENYGRDPTYWAEEFFYKRYPELDPRNSTGTVRPRANQGTPNTNRPGTSRPQQPTQQPMPVPGG